jgi:hypothetical protein
MARPSTRRRRQRIALVATLHAWLSSAADETCVPSPAHTQMTWNTSDIDAEVVALKARGVSFEEYDTPDLKTVNSVATIARSKGAWFKDSEGNLLALGQFDGRPMVR